METDHRVVIGDARSLDLPPESVELVVTSPPYPMIEMWDDLFSRLDPTIAEQLESGDGAAAFEAMHTILDEVWAAVDRLLVDGGIACINVGDATRTLDRFRVYSNHARIAETFERRGFDPLPDILWHKPTNSPSKFMGSGMLAPNAYVTLEHEHILVFRKGDRREFEPGASERYEAAFFWEERNEWFSDIWEVKGERQALSDLWVDDTPGESTGSSGGGVGSATPNAGSDAPPDDPTDTDTATPSTAELRDRSGSFPFEIPYRLINMYSVYGDTVLDPFWGTGTTSLAAVTAGRSSVGVELEPTFADVFEQRIADSPELSRRVIEDRLQGHREFVTHRRKSGDLPDYEADHYDFPVTTKQEQAIQFYVAHEVMETDDGYRVTHEPY